MSSLSDGHRRVIVLDNLSSPVRTTCNSLGRKPQESSQPYALSPVGATLSRWASSVSPLWGFGFVPTTHLGLTPLLLYTSRPEGSETHQPRAERSAALGRRTPCSQALKGRNNMLAGRCSICFSLSGLSRSSPSTPGRRCALPWADMSRPIRGESGRPTCVKQRGLTPQAISCRRYAAEDQRVSSLQSLTVVEHSAVDLDQPTSECPVVVYATAIVRPMRRKRGE